MCHFPNYSGAFSLEFGRESNGERLSNVEDRKPRVKARKSRVRNSRSSMKDRSRE